MSSKPSSGPLGDRAYYMTVAEILAQRRARGASELAPLQAEFSRGSADIDAKYLNRALVTREGSNREAKHWLRAEGIAVCHHAPISVLARALIATGHDGNKTMGAWRNFDPGSRSAHGSKSPTLCFTPAKLSWWAEQAFEESTQTRLRRVRYRSREEGLRRGGGGGKNSRTASPGTNPAIDTLRAPDTRRHTAKRNPPTKPTSKGYERS